MEAIYPDGRTEVLNSVPQYRFNWHINYVYTKDSAPVLPKGTIIKTTAWHDNTQANKFNPDPASVGDLRPAERRRDGARQRGRRLHHRGGLRADHRGAEESGCHQHAAATAVGSQTDPAAPTIVSTPQAPLSRPVQRTYPKFSGCSFPSCRDSVSPLINQASGRGSGNRSPTARRTSIFAVMSHCSAEGPSGSAIRPVG